MSPESDCYGADDGQHGARCHCGRPAKWHIYYGSGCGHVCGIHKGTISRRKGAVVRLRALPSGSHAHPDGVDHAGDFQGR